MVFCGYHATHGFRQALGTEVRPSSGALSAGMTDVWSAGAIGAISEAEVHQVLRSRLRLSADQADSIMDDMWRQYLGTANTELIEYPANCVRNSAPGS
jgi:hypothetical protein